MEPDPNRPIVRSYQDCVTNDGKDAIVIGKYMAVSEPVKGIVQVDLQKNHAMIIVSDDTYVFLESLDSPKAIRARTELVSFDGKLVEAFGTIHLIMPSSGQSLINPCISPVMSIRLHEPRI